MTRGNFGKEDLRVIKSHKDYYSHSKKENQRGAAIIVAIIALAIFLKCLVINKLSALDMILGIVFGMVMYRGDFSFSANLRNPVLKHSYKFTLLFWKMCVITTIGINGIVLYGLYKNTFDYQTYLNEPTPVSIYFCLAAVVFGMGLMLLGSAGSGIIKKVVNLKGDFLIALVFYFIGSIFGVYIRERVIAIIGEHSLYMPEMYGFKDALFLQFFFLYLYFLLAYTGAQRHGIYKQRDFTSIANILKMHISLKKKINLLKEEIFLSGIEANAGIYYIAIIAIIYFYFNHKVIATAMPLSTVGYKIINFIGFDLSKYLDSSLVAKINKSIFEQPNIMLITGYALGCLLLPLLRCEYKPTRPANFKEVINSILGGFLVGFGAQGIRGANIGEVFGAISMLSLSGYIIIPFILIGLLIAKPLYKYLNN